MYKLWGKILEKNTHALEQNEWKNRLRRRLYTQNMHTKRNGKDFIRTEKKV